MNNLLFIILFVFCGIDVFFIVRAICRGKRVFMQFIPSLGWLIAMVIPFMAQCYDLLPESINMQAFGILLVGSLLLLGDAIRIKPLVHQDMLETSTGVPQAIYRFFTCENVYLIAFLALAVINLLSMDTIPLVYKLSHPEVDSATLSVLRAQSTKMLDVPLVFNYLFEWA
ncbi:MAG: hypothetical protein RR826_06675, partial [Christensenellaceae bacterium]